MTFPDTPRVVYARNPLETVICQLRFPPILRIATELPTTFQERIRAVYPLLSERRDEQLLGVPAGSVPPEILKLIGEDLPLGGNRYYDFASADRAWTVTLNRDFLALTARDYRQWSDFRSRLIELMDALRDAYAPTFFIRVGLRYRNVIVRNALELADMPWGSLLQPHIVGELSSAIADRVRQISSNVLIELVQGGHVRVRHGLKQQEDAAKAPYIIDSDFHFDEQTEVQNALARLDDFNREAGRLFRSAIQDRLHHAMAPQVA